MWEYVRWAFHTIDSDSSSEGTARRKKPPGRKTHARRATEITSPCGLNSSPYR